MCSCHSILECCVTFSGVKLSIRSFVLFIHVSRPPSQSHGCDLILRLSGSLQKAHRGRGCIHTGIWKKSSELVQNRCRIQVVWKSEPEIRPVGKHTIPFSYEQERQVQLRSRLIAHLGDGHVSLIGCRPCRPYLFHNSEGGNLF